MLGVEMSNLIKNPLKFDSPDPFITYHDGFYYLLCSERTKIVIHRSKELSKIFDDEYKTVFLGGTNGVIDCIWAPEMHKINNKWYIYSSGTSESQNYRTIRMFCLESENDDPFSDYHFKGFTDSEIYAIDQTIFHDKSTDKYYDVFVQIRPETGNTIMIGELETPWKIGPNRTMLKHTEFEWEKKKGRVTEGPFFFEHNGRTFMIYSANDTFSPFYCLGLMEYIGGDPLNKDNWICYDKPFFESGNDVYAVGHASVFKSPTDKEYWLCYHGNSSTEKYDRSCYVQKFSFGEDGLPIFGEPVSREEKILAPV